MFMKKQRKRGAPRQPDARRNGGLYRVRPSLTKVLKRLAGKEGVTVPSLLELIIQEHISREKAK